VGTAQLLLRFAQASHQPTAKKGVFHIGEQLHLLQPITQLIGVFRETTVLRLVTVEIKLALQLLPLNLVDGFAQMQWKIEDIVFGHGGIGSSDGITMAVGGSMRQPLIPGIARGINPMLARAGLYHPLFLS
jgi:hypothetical protein